MKTLRIPEIASHEPLLPQWGPYSKKYFGVSQVADAAEALRFDAFLNTYGRGSPNTSPMQGSRR